MKNRSPIFIFDAIFYLTTDDIKVRFFQTDENNKQIWEAWGKFTEADVHHQYAIGNIVNLQC